MNDLTQTVYDDWRNWIKKARSVRSMSWEDLKYAGKADETGLLTFINDHIYEDCFAKITISEWYALVESQKTTEAEEQRIKEDAESTMLMDPETDNNATIPISPGSSWQLYRKHLKEDLGFSEHSIKCIQESCFTILKRLNGDTRESGPVKGLVVGNVQSGKTANMASLMAMAADNGWNMFIILSGTIENLRVQTERRLNNDLNCGDGNLEWIALPRELKKRKNAVQGQTKHLYLKESSRKRYFAVCLKHVTRLKNLIDWIQSDPHSQEMLRILVIDDEADQASVNTADVEKGDENRKAINRLLVNLVECRSKKGSPSTGKYLAMNYVCYTATPYANFLNENYPQSLYPKDFLVSLQSSKQYFGPNQIFGTGEESSDGMDIIRMISMKKSGTSNDEDQSDYKKITMIHNGESLEAPETLKDSLAWFICSVAAMRLNGYKKPISMLIHTSVSTIHHAFFAEVIKRLLAPANRAALIDRCRQVYQIETTRFTKEKLRIAYPDYERNQEDIPTFPIFDDLLPDINLLLSIPATPIPMSEDQEEMQYHKGIHLCVDNCENNGVNDENMHLRLVYPDDDAPDYPKPAPAFIVIGGSTLSRGLTIQGLVSTYFARKVNLADSLMQMARWFGYRRNYEIYPRIWMLEKTRSQFEFLTALDNELRDELKQYHIMGKKPSEFGPRVKNTPKAGFIQITSKKKMQMATEVEFDFTGTRTETITFLNDADFLRHNIDVTFNMIRALSAPGIGRKQCGYVWRNVDFSLIDFMLLSKCRFTTEGKVFNQIAAFTNWIKAVTADGNLSSWNVAVAGGCVDPSDSSAWVLPNGRAVQKIRRNNKKNHPAGHLNVGAVRDPKDNIIDVNDELLSDEAKAKLVNIAANHYEIRHAAGLDKTPLLIIYCIDKDSKPTSDNSPREPLDAVEDVVAFSITIPGMTSGSNTAKRLQVRSLTIENENEGDI